MRDAAPARCLQRLSRLKPAGRLLDDGRYYAVLSAAGFSLKAIFVKLAYAAMPIDAVTLLALRMGLALPLFVWLGVSGGRADRARLDAGAVLQIVFLGMFGYYLSSLFDFYGLEFISAGLERLVLYTYPTLVLLFHALLTRTWPRRSTAWAMGLCYLGLGVAFLHDASVSPQNVRVLQGVAWVFASAVTYALYYIGTGKLLKRVGSMRLAGLAGSVSSILVLAHYAINAHLPGLSSVTPSVWAYAAMMAVFSTALPVYWMAIAIQRMGAAQAAALGNLGPVLTLFAAWVLLGEAVSLYQAAGLVLVLLGVSRLKQSP